ncbi:MAG: hypothetical protein ACOX84_10215 [Methanothrix sp.]|jgi:hypothetical protein|uniref:hypothetical protein n=1 Tax=Methanothrix sp. TaxID=90426 RepID=UPI001BD276F4
MNIIISNHLYSRNQLFLSGKVPPGSRSDGYAEKNCLIFLYIKHEISFTWDKNLGLFGDEIEGRFWEYG